MSAAGPVRAALVVIALGLAAGAGHAGIFDDEEARKAIVDLRKRISDGDDELRARTTELATASTQMAEQLAALRRSLLDLNNQLEAMRGEVAKLRGNDEQIMRELSEVQKRQKDMTQALDGRLAKLEPVKVSLDGREFIAEAAERQAYDDAMAAIRGGEFDKALVLLNGFQRRFQGSGYTDNVRFWTGNALYGRREYKEAIAVFRAFVAASPDHPRAPEALLAVANSQAEMKDVRGARRTIDELTKAYPQSEAAVAGKERLASLK
jgi:tol-pal system protein YbgF